MSELTDAIERVEKSHFRSHGDTGAHSNALIVWNALRREAGLPPLTQRDLMVRVLEDYQRCAGRALQSGQGPQAENYAVAANKVEQEIADYDETHPKVVVRETRCFS